MRLTLAVPGQDQRPRGAVLYMVRPLGATVLFNGCVLENMIFVAFFVNYLKRCKKYFWKIQLFDFVGRASPPLSAAPGEG